MAASDDSPQWVRVARLTQARGLNGEVLARANYPAAKYGFLREVRLRKPDGSWLRDGEAFAVASIRDYKGGLVYKFYGVEDRSAAEALEGCEVLIREADRPRLPDSEFYVSDLLGCEVFDLRTARRVGVVESWQEFGGPELLEVKTGSGRLLWIPLVKAICVEVDPAAARIVIDPPEGLLDLNEERDAG